MAENAPDIEHGESSYPNKEEKTLVPAESEERGDVSQDLPMEVDADLSMQTEQKNINEAFVHLVYNFKLAEMNKYLL